MKPQFYEVRVAKNITSCLEIRRSVFIEGQGVPEDIEIDGHDDQCIHFLGEIGGIPIATLRIKKQGPQVKIQRVAVLEDYRDTGAGRHLMKEAIVCCQLWGFQEAILGAQVAVIGFYEKLGFTAYGERYVEAGIEHQDMRLTL